GALVIGLVAGALFVKAFTWTQKNLKVDDVLGVWALHGLCGVWGALAVGIVGLTALGGLGGVAMESQIVGTLMGISVAVVGAAVVYGLIKVTMGLRLTQEEEYNGADLSIHRIHANPPRDDY
ncbi:MAG TPA: ammonium transporter, partial [Thiomicrospira sp.]|nr:ammonium transporter [Thiomicrospira sp.]